MLGLGLITGASCDDPSGIAAYSQAGAQCGWPTGSDRLPPDAQAFYRTIIFATLIGVGINFIGLNPVKALFWTAVIKGVVAVPLVVVIMIMAMAPKVIGQFTLSRGLSAMGWLCTAVMAMAVAIMFAW